MAQDTERENALNMEAFPAFVNKGCLFGNRS